MALLIPNKKNNGFVALVVVLVMNAVGVMIIMFLLFHSGLFSDNVNSFQSAAEARGFAGACSEEALLAIKDNPVDAQGEMSFEGGKCSYEVVNYDNIFFIKSIGHSRNYTVKQLLNAQKENDLLKVVFYDDNF
ncbi:MAG: hypothetical protein WCX74_01680 [Candidatus Paceibacterota bacterium]